MSIYIKDFVPPKSAQLKKSYKKKPYWGKGKRVNYSQRSGKYNAKKVKYDGKLFASKHEAERYAELKSLERFGIITDLRTQIKFELIPKGENQRACNYYADFVYYQNGVQIVEDTKGYRTDVYKLKKKLMYQVWKIKIKET